MYLTDDGATADQGGNGGGGGGGGNSVRKGDWTCPNESCGANVFASKHKCYRCDTPKPDPSAAKAAGSAGSGDGGGGARVNTVGIMSESVVTPAGHLRALVRTVTSRWLGCGLTSRVLGCRLTRV